MRLACSAGLVAALALLIAATPPVAAQLRLRPLVSLYADAEGEGLRRPEGIGCGGEAFVLVADSGNGRLVRFAVEADALRAEQSLRLPQLPSPRRVRIRSGGEALVLDGKLRRIGRVSPAGEFLGYLEPSGPGLAGAAPVPRSLALDAEGRIYLLDVLSARVLVLDGEGRLERQIAFPPERGFLSDLAVDRRGRVYAVDSVERRILMAGPGEEALVPWSEVLAAEALFPTSLEIDGDGRLLVADRHGGQILVVGADGSFRGRASRRGWKEGLLRYPEQICFDGSGRMYVADAGNHRVQVFGVGP